MLKKILKNKYTQYAVITAIVLIMMILIHDFFVKRSCTNDVADNSQFFFSDGSSYYRYPYLYNTGETKKILQSFSKNNKNGFKKFNSLNDAEKYCFIKKSLF